MIIRYFFWLLMFHLLTFYKQKPVAFFIGIVLWPWHALNAFFHAPDLHKEMVENGVEGLKSYWQIPGAITPPRFVQRKFEELGREASR